MSGAAGDLSFGMSDAEMASRRTVFAPDALAGKTVMISGGGSGIGKATAWLAGRCGARIVLCGRTGTKLEAAASAMRKAELRVNSFTVNIRDEVAVAALFNEIDEAIGGIDVLVNSAGGQFPQEAIDYRPKGWRAVIDTNLNGTWWMMQAAALAWRAKGRGGSIVNVVTMTDRGMPGVAHSCAARAGVIALSKSVAIEWAPLGIRINCIAPGTIDSEGMAVYEPATHLQFRRSNPQMRLASPWEVAEAILFLGSGASSFTTGETLAVDGGGKLWGEHWTVPRPAYFDGPAPTGRP